MDTNYYRIELLTNGQGKLSDFCPIVIDNTTKACSENAVAIAHTICTAIVVVAALIVAGIIVWRIIEQCHKRRVAEIDTLRQERESLYKLKSNYQARILDKIVSQMEDKSESYNEELKKYIEEIDKIIESIDVKLGNKKQDNKPTTTQNNDSKTQ